MNESLITDVDNTSVTPPQNYLTELVGEDKKFKTTEDLAKGKWESDNYVKLLTRQIDEMRSDVLTYKKDSDTKANLQALVDKLEQATKQTTNSTQPPANVDTPRSLDSNEIKSLVSNEVLSIENERKKQQNFEMVRGKLKERFGDRSSDVVKQHIESLGISQTRLDEMARTEPQLLIKALGLDTPAPQPDYQAPPRSSQRSDNFAPSAGQKRTWAYYQKLMRDKPDLKFDPKTNISMHNDMLALGKDFEDGDFHKYN